jgi:hypothetical protein
MKTKKPTRTELLLTVMRILAWVAFIGFMLEAGAILVSYGVSCVNPEAAKNLYEGMDLYTLKQFSFAHYTLYVFLIFVLLIMKSFVWYLVIGTLSKINLANPFKMEVAQMLEKISYRLFAIWLVAIASSAHTAWLVKITGEHHGDWASRFNPKTI